MQPPIYQTGVTVLPGFFILAVLLLGFCFWIWMLVDAIQNRGLGEGEKIGWVLAIVFLHVLAASVYFFIGRPRGRLPHLVPAGGV
jgi:hypothetical protein